MTWTAVCISLVVDDLLLLESESDPVSGGRGKGINNDVAVQTLVSSNEVVYRTHSHSQSREEPDSKPIDV